MNAKIKPGSKVIVYRMAKIGVLTGEPFKLENRVMRKLACLRLGKKLTQRELNGQFINVSGLKCPLSWVGRYEF